MFLRFAIDCPILLLALVCTCEKTLSELGDKLTKEKYRKAINKTKDALAGDKDKTSKDDGVDAEYEVKDEK